MGNSTFTISHLFNLKRRSPCM
uniref:Uncharacterized protein n=1 Tax=Arundo donax TaxID=35708 RepID=A0A0A9B4P6_ARUDO